MVMAMDDAGSWDDGESSAPLSALQLGVRGYACNVFDDARVAWSLHREQHLIPWRMESDLRVDRFDARNLLDDRSLFRQRKKPRGAAADSAATDIERELHALRYGDYEVEFPRPVDPKNEQIPAHVENAFAYAYPEDRDDDDDEGGDGVNSRELFEPPWVVPAHILQPKSKKLHEIIAATAKKARAHPQLEVMLKVKLHTSAAFGFLAPTHGFHAYYAYLRDEDPPLRPATKAQPTVSLLGDEYNDESDEDDGDEAVKDNSKDSEAASNKDKGMASSEGSKSVAADDDAKKAARLRRAKLLAGHFQRATLESAVLHSHTRERSASPTRPVKRRHTTGSE